MAWWIEGGSIFLSSKVNQTDSNRSLVTHCIEGCFCHSVGLTCKVLTNLVIFPRWHGLLLSGVSW